MVSLSPESLFISICGLPKRQNILYCPTITYLQVPLVFILYNVPKQVFEFQSTTTEAHLWISSSKDNLFIPALFLFVQFSSDFERHLY